MDAESADRALRELVEHLAHRRSLLAWTIAQCPDGDASWSAIWEAATDAKAMINVLVAVGSIRGARVNAAPYVVGVPRENATVQLVVTTPDGTVVEHSARVDDLSRVVRAENPWPTLHDVVEAVPAR